VEALGASFLETPACDPDSCVLRWVSHTPPQTCSPGASVLQETISWWPAISDWLQPELVGDGWPIYKSGYRTGTTVGQLALPRTSRLATFAWGPDGGQTRTVIFHDVVRVTTIGWGFGDSGGPVFTVDPTGKYYALGIQASAAPSPPVGQTACVGGTSCTIYFSAWDNVQLRTGLTFNPAEGQEWEDPPCPPGSPNCSIEDPL